MKIHGFSRFLTGFLGDLGVYLIHLPKFCAGHGLVRAE
jgi:hypothetical protein